MLLTKISTLLATASIASATIFNGVRTRPCLPDKRQEII